MTQVSENSIAFAKPSYRRTGKIWYDFICGRIALEANVANISQEEEEEWIKGCIFI